MPERPSITSGKRSVWYGALFWALFSVIVVMLRGIHWDEHYEFAQVILQQVKYPDNHPFFRCTRNSLNLQVYTSALLLWLNSDPIFLNGFRNILWMLGTTLPMYLLATRISGRPIMGHVAVLLTLLGLHEAFDAAYRMNAYPFYSSTGHIGRAYALFTLSVLLSRSWKTGLFLFGIMPVVHIGQMPILFWWAILFIVASWLTTERRNILRAMPWGALSLVICIIVWMSRAFISVEAPIDGPYFSESDAHSLWAAYVARDDIHRALPGNMVKYTNSFLILGMALLIIGAASRVEWKAKPARYLWCWIFVYVSICAGSVWGIMGINYLIGADVPYILIAWMPYRFTNHGALLLLAVLPCLLLHQAQGNNSKRVDTGSILLCLALLFGLLAPALQWILPGSVYDSYFRMTDGVMFFLCGSVFSLLHRRLKDDDSFRTYWSVLSIVGCGVMLVSHQFGTVAALSGFLMERILFIAQSRRNLDPLTTLSSVGLRSVLGALVIFVTVTQLYRQWEPEQNAFKPSELDMRVKNYLVESGEEDAVLLARPDQYTLQARTKHPVMVDSPLVGWIAYMPSLAPSIDKILDDFYGMGMQRAAETSWVQLWRDRSESEWKALADEYGLRYILSPAGIPLQLEELFTSSNPWGHVETFYRIPGTENLQ